MIKFVRACALVLLLTCSAVAGDIQNGSPQPPPPPPSESTTSSSSQAEPAAEGDVPNDVADTLTEAALSVLNNVLALL
jgi:hypothetical protein